MNICICTLAFGLPRVRPVCGMPLKRSFASAAPWSALGDVALPVVPSPCMSFAETIPEPPPPPPPLVSATPRTIAITMARTMPPPIASATGDACRVRAPPAPFERTGGGAAAAARLCSLALFPLGMGRKGSRFLFRLVLTGRREDQESDEEQEAGEREGGDREIAEAFLGEPVGGAARSGHRARVRLLDHVALDQHV